MSTTVIASKTQKVKFGFWPVKEEVTTTLQLVNLGKGNFAIDYYSRFTGIKDGNTKGGPIRILGNTEELVNAHPEVKVTVKNFSTQERHVSMHIIIAVDIPFIGMKTIYDQTLGGTFEHIAGWQLSLANLEAAMDERGKLGVTTY